MNNKSLYNDPQSDVPSPRRLRRPFFRRGSIRKRQEQTRDDTKPPPQPTRSSSPLAAMPPRAAAAPKDEINEGNDGDISPTILRTIVGTSRFQDSTSTLNADDSFNNSFSVSLPGLDESMNTMSLYDSTQEPSSSSGYGLIEPRRAAVGIPAPPLGYGARHQHPSSPYNASRASMGYSSSSMGYLSSPSRTDYNSSYHYSSPLQRPYSQRLAATASLPTSLPLTPPSNSYHQPSPYTSAAAAMTARNQRHSLLQPAATQSMTMIEVAPGVSARLRGSVETWRAIQNDFYLPTSCPGCETLVFGIQDAGYVLCPMCRIVVPMPDEYVDRVSQGVGLGFTFEDLEKWQAELTGPRGSKGF